MSVDTKIRPFDIEHDIMSAHSILEILIENPPPDGFPAGVDDLKTIIVSAAVFNEHIINIKAFKHTWNINTYPNGV